MPALHFDGTTLTYQPDHPAPTPAPGEVPVRVLKAGVCNTDLEITKGYMGFTGVPGHEFVGVAEDGPLAGQRVAGEINLACGECPTCRAGYPTQCPHRTTLGIGDDAAVFVEPLAAALQTLAITHVSPHDRVVLIGAGKLGLLTAQVLALTGCDLTAVARHERQYDLLARWGIEAVAGVPANTADIVVDCTGAESGFAAALEAVRPRGVVHLKSTYHGLPQADLTRAVVDEVQIHTSRCGPFPAAIRLLAAGHVEVEPRIEARYPLAEGVAAFEHAARKGALKVIVDVGE